MRYLVMLFLLPLICSFSGFEDLYKLELKTRDGQKLNLSDFKGKKILFITLPISEADSVVSTIDLKELESKYYNTLIVVGIPCEDFGYKKEDELRVLNIYKNQLPNFILTEGMRVKKNNYLDQSALFQWLTNKDKNRHFDHDIPGPGQKYFVDEKGELFASMGPAIKLSNPIIEKILSRAIK